MLVNNTNGDFFMILEINKFKKMQCCPHCKGNNIVKYGKYKDRQRYKCMKCGKTFNCFTNKPWSYTKKSLSLWEKYISNMKNATLREHSKALKINIATAFFWRKKILNNLVKEKALLDKNVSITSRVIIENRKGKKNIEVPPKRLYLIYGISSTIRDKIRVISSISLKEIKLYCNDYIDKNSYLLKNGNRYVEIYAKEFNKGKKKIIRFYLLQLNNLIYL